MCNGKYEKDPVSADFRRKIFYVRRKASYHLRDRYRRIGGKNCVYCGFKAQTGDHVPALFLGYVNGVVKGVIVSSCYDCNKVLGSLPSTCLKERATFLSTFYEEEMYGITKFVDNPTAELEWREKEDVLKLKTTRCRQRMNAINCNMIKGSAALFKENGEGGGETTSTVYSFLQKRMESAEFI